MERALFLKQSPTAQVKTLVCDVLADGQVHTRQELLAHIEKTAKDLGLPPYRDGCLSGGLRQALIEMNCEKISAGAYQASADIQIKAGKRGFSARAAQICESTAERLSELAREVDYVKASNEEIKQLGELRQCVQTLLAWQKKFDNGK